MTLSRRHFLKRVGSTGIVTVAAGAELLLPGCSDDMPATKKQNHYHVEIDGTFPVPMKEAMYAVLDGISDQYPRALMDFFLSVKALDPEEVPYSQAFDPLPPQRRVIEERQAFSSKLEEMKNRLRRGNYSESDVEELNKMTELAQRLVEETVEEKDIPATIHFPRELQERREKLNFSPEDAFAHECGHIVLERSVLPPYRRYLEEGFRRITPYRETGLPDPLPAPENAGEAVERINVLLDEGKTTADKGYLHPDFLAEGFLSAGPILNRHRQDIIGRIAEFRHYFVAGTQEANVLASLSSDLEKHKASPAAEDLADYFGFLARGKSVEGEYPKVREKLDILAEVLKNPSAFK